MAKCSVCKQREGSKSAIVKGSYYSKICGQCYEDLLADNTVSTGHADYERGRDTEEHEADIRQPWNNGKLDSEFVRLYPETAKKIATPEEINRAIRS